MIAAALLLTSCGPGGGTTAIPVPTMNRPTVATGTPSQDIGSTWERPADGMVMMYVPAGEFTMGSDRGEPNEKPVHTVYLDAYWIDRTEVTNGMYIRCVEAGACDPPSDYSSNNRIHYHSDPKYVDYPVIYVDWYDAEAYCEWAEVRLPTEAEWEKASRGTDGREYPWGDGIPTCSLANYWLCNGDTNKVSSYADGRSLYDVYDLAGNVWEWVSDWYGEYSPLPVNNPTGPASGEYRVWRGGSLGYEEYWLRSSFRNWADPELSNDSIGFRCSRSISP